MDDLSARPPSASEPPPRRARILSVEDDPTLAAMERRALGHEGYEVLIAQSAPEARALLATTRVDAIIVDYSLPGETGVDLCESLGDGAPRILVSAFGTLQVIGRALRAGVRDFVATDGQFLPELLASLTRVLAQEAEARAREAEAHAAAGRLADEREALRNAARRRVEFFSALSHEIRTPLSSITTSSEALIEGVYGPLNDAQRQALEGIQESGRLLRGLVDDVLDAAKLEAGKVTLYAETVSTRDLVETVLRQVAHAAAARRVQLTHAVADDAGALEADGRRVVQILVNLLSNAVKFTPAAGTVRVDVDALPDEGALRFTVSDTGAGLTQAQQARLFQPFSQVETDLSRRGGGTGLGLVLVRQLAELHGGGVRLESTVGHGTRVEVRLPRVRATHPAEAGASAARS